MTETLEQFMNQTHFTIGDKERVDNIVFNSSLAKIIDFEGDAAQVTFKSKSAKPVTYVLPRTVLTSQQILLLQSNKRNLLKYDNNNNSKLSKRSNSFKKRKRNENKNLKESGDET